MLPSDLPQGVFRFLIDTWFTIRVTFVSIIEFFTDYVISLGSEDISVLSVLIGSGIFIYIGYVIIKFITGLIL